jgi:hypothetical protein
LVGHHLWLIDNSAEHTPCRVSDLTTAGRLAATFRSLGETLSPRSQLARQLAESAQASSLVRIASDTGARMAKTARSMTKKVI